MLKETKKGILIPVKITPKASCNTIVGWEQDELKIKIKAPADKGKANEELIAFLSKTWKIPKSSFSIHSGETSRHKRLCVQGCSLEILEDRIDLDDTRKALASTKKNGTASWESIKKKLDL